MIIAYLITLLIIIFAYLGFGLYLLSFLKLKFTIWEKLVLALILSISILSLSFVLLAYLISTTSYYLLVPASILGLIGFWQERKMFPQLWQSIKKHPWLSILIVLTIVSLTTGLFFSGFIRQGNLELQDTYDSPWHVALIKESLNNLPPRHPSNSKIVLNNYHYFYDVFLASLGFFSQLPVLNLYYQVGQLLMATILILSAVVFAGRLKSKNAAALLVFFIAFVGNFAYLIPLFIPGQSWSDSSFWVAQTFSMMVNPQLVFSIATFHVLLLLLTKDFDQKKERHYLMMALILPSVGFKSYGWILMCLLYGMDLLFNFLKQKKFIYIVYGLIFIFLSLPIVYLMTGFKTNNFFYHPLWFIDSMFEAIDRLNYPNWSYLLQAYAAQGSNLRLFLLRAVQIIIFFIGNLGIRIIFLLFPFWRFSKKQKLWKNQQKIIDILFVLFVFSSVFPLFFLQTGTVWNTIQFWYYSLIFANILAVLVCLQVSKKWKQWQKFLAIVLLIILSTPTFVKATISRWRSFEQIPEQEVSLLASLDDDNKIMICPDGSWWYRHSIVSALTPGEVYLADPSQVNLLNLKLDEFESFSLIFEERNLVDLEKIINSQEIDYILCADQAYSQFLQGLNWQETEFKNWQFFSNDLAK